MMSKSLPNNSFNPTRDSMPLKMLRPARVECLRAVGLIRALDADRPRKTSLSRNCLCPDMHSRVLSPRGMCISFSGHASPVSQGRQTIAAQHSTDRRRFEAGLPA